jgi:hypothetical protein
MLEPKHSVVVHSAAVVAAAAGLSWVGSLQLGRAIPGDFRCRDLRLHRRRSALVRDDLPFVPGAFALYI